MTDKITLVIPVYNDEAHIEQCLTSALSQSLPACEVIVIDDGSTDCSGAIALEFQDRYPTMKVIRHERNLGLVRAWQHGVSLAKGDYIAFLDSDDWLDSGYLAELAAGIGTGADIVCCNHNRVYRDRTVFQQEKIPAGVYPRERMIREVFPVLINDGTYLGRGLTPHRCGKLFRKSLLLDNLHFCDPEISYGEDLNIFFPAIQDCGLLVVLDDRKGLYYYRQNEASMIHSYKAEMFRQITSLRARLLDAMDAKAVYDFTGQLNRDFWCLFMEYVKNEAKAGHCLAKSGEVLHSYRVSVKSVPAGGVSLRFSDRLLMDCLQKNSKTLVFLWMKLYALLRKG